MRSREAGGGGRRVGERTRRGVNPPGLGVYSGPPAHVHPGTSTVLGLAPCSPLQQ